MLRMPPNTLNCTVVFYELGMRRLSATQVHELPIIVPATSKHKAQPYRMKTGRLLALVLEPVLAT
jgi:hypothetical protein